MLIVMGRSVNYCLFFGGITNIEAIFVWFVCNNIIVRIAGSHICLVSMRQSRSLQLHCRTLQLCPATRLRVRVARQNCRCDITLRLCCAFLVLVFLCNARHDNISHVNNRQLLPSGMPQRKVLISMHAVRMRELFWYVVANAAKYSTYSWQYRSTTMY